eukprot:977696_1
MAENINSPGKQFVQSLNKVASQPIDDGIISLENSVRLQTYFRMMNSVYNQGKSYMNENDIARAYIFLQRYCLVYMKIKEHNAFGQPQYRKEAAHHRKYVGDTLGNLEKLKEFLTSEKNKRVAEQNRLEAAEQKQRQEAAAAAETAPTPSAPPQEEAAPSQVSRMPSSQRWSNLRVPSRVPAPIPTPAPSPTIAPAPTRIESTDILDLDEPFFGTRRIHVPTSLISEFLRHAHRNTKRDIETCAMLCGTLKHNELFITTVVVPKQSGTANTVAMEGDEELIDLQINMDLIVFGWIHTHPSQSCFLSSVDLHTHFPYQLTLPEAIAIVCAPTAKPDIGVFSLSDAGIKSLKNCDRRGFHHHSETDVYGPAKHCVFDQVGKCKFIDLR